MLKKKKKYNIAIVGATGLVGRTFIQILEEYQFPIGELRLLASKNSEGKKITAFEQEFVVQTLNEHSFKDMDLALFSAGGSVSLTYAPFAVKSGALVIDNSSAWRMVKDVPLIVPEVNPNDLKFEGIIANPNCSTIQVVLPLKALDLAYGIDEVNYTTYQAVSGSGQKGKDDLILTLDGKDPEFYPYSISKTCIPQIDVFLENDYTKEEMKMVEETRKILHHDKLLVSATCIRVPVANSHGVNVVLKLQKEFEIKDIRNVLSQFPGIIVLDDPKNSVYPVSTVANGNDFVYVGRIRRDLIDPQKIIFYCVSDNIRKGAASNAVSIAKLAIERI